MSAPSLERPTAPATEPKLPTMPTRAFGSLKALVNSLASPLVPSDYLDLFDPLRSGADLRGRVVSVTQETADAVTTTIKPGKGWRGHTPGQYIRLGVDIDGVRQWRAYSLTHALAPGATTDANGHISITTKAIPDGRVSTFLNNGGLTPGTLVHLDQATGDFTLPPVAPAKVLFITAGSGITPVIGMLRNRLADLPDVTHVHIAPSHDSVIFGAEIRGYAGAPSQPSSSGFSAQSHKPQLWDASSRPKPGLSGFGRESQEASYRLVEHHDDTDGFLDLARDLDELVPDWREREAWVCGPTGLLDSAESLWAAADLAYALHVERFRPTVIEGGEGGAITFLSSDLTVDADGSTPILAAGEDAGLIMPSGCRMGICFGCVVTMRQGAIRDLRTGEITVVEPGDELPIQTCINAVAGHCDLEL